MPFKSKAQHKKFRAMEASGEMPKGTASRWAHHTKNIKALPEHVKKTKKTQHAKKAFVAEFLAKCAAAGLTTPAQVAAAAEALCKQASVLSTMAGQATGLGALAPLLGTVAIPAAGGYALGTLGAKAKNQADEDDADALRLRAEANAYRRRAVEAKTHAQVRQLVEGDPNKYVVLS